MIKYIPKYRNKIPLVDSESVWANISTIIWDIIHRFDLKQDRALEFGVYRGCSTSALGHYFKEVIAVDLFEGNTILGRSTVYERVRESLKNYPVRLIMADYKEYINDDTQPKYDLIHIDIIHTYEDTFACGDWACKYSDCVIFHDTGMPDIHECVTDLAEKHSMTYYNFEEGCWLGILVRE